MENKQNIRISYDDINDPRVNNILKRLHEEADFRDGGRSDVEVTDTEESLIHKSWFNLMMAGMVGAFIAWALVEPSLDDSNFKESVAVLMIFMVAGFVGLFIGCMDGILSKNLNRAVKTGGISFLMALGGVLLSIIIGGQINLLLSEIGEAIVSDRALADPYNHLSGFVYMMINRSIIWVFIGMAIGLGPGIALKSKKMVLNGFLGGLIGGILGGLLFDPIDYLLGGGDYTGGAETSRAIGLMVLGGCTGLMIGLVEQLTKEAWLFMTEGPLRGKQFIVYKNPTQIGSSPKCDIYLFKDPNIEPIHARIRIMRDGYEIEDNNSTKGTFVNGKLIRSNKKLNNNDIIQIGEVKFVYSEKERKE